MKAKVIVPVAVLSILFTGCSSGVKDIKPFTLEEVAGKRLAKLSLDEQEGIIYKHVMNSITVDKERLIRIENKDLENINRVLEGVNEALRGQKNGVISDEYANYLLLEFARTPYEWKQVSVDPVGFDPATRLYFVDVTYRTTDVVKSVIPASKIPNGSPNEELLKQKRYTDYIAYLNMKYSGNSGLANDLREQFESRWGSINEIMQEQQGVSLLERTRYVNQSSGGLGKLTYAGLVGNTSFNVGAEMVMRYVFKYNFNLGEETDMKVESFYLKEFNLDNGDYFLIENLTNDAGIEVLNPFIDKLILSYHKAVEESNDVGLYQLYHDYGLVDKYYEDLNRYTYNSIGGYNFKVLKREGNNLLVRVDRVYSVRARGANMSLPTYEETLVYNLLMGNDDRIRIKDIHLIKAKLVGEPISVIKNVSGISDLIQYSGESFTETNKQKVEEVLKKFSEVVFNAKVDTLEFTDVVDIGVSQTTLQKMTDFITAIPNATRKVNYIVSWDTKTNVFVSVTLREIFETPNGNYDTESVVDLINRNGEWKVVNYIRTLSVKTTSTNMNTKNALSENIRSVTDSSSGGGTSTNSENE